MSHDISCHVTMIVVYMAPLSHDDYVMWHKRTDLERHKSYAKHNHRFREAFWIRCRYWFGFCCWFCFIYSTFVFQNAFQPPLPKDTVVSFYIQAQKLVVAVYHLNLNSPQKREVTAKYQVHIYTWG